MTKISWVFRFLFSTIDETSKQSVYEPIDVTRPWRIAFGRGPLGSTVGFRNLATQKRLRL